jgi:transcriptional regulator with XRE-family HTH domain
LTYFAQNLKHLRKKSSKTQEQLGNEIQLGRTTIANYESGVSSPTDPEVLIRLSQLFCVSIDELLTRDLSMAFTTEAHVMPDMSWKEEFAEPVTNFINHKRTLYETTIKMNHFLGASSVIIVDNHGDEKMAFVSIAEMKNYLSNREDASYISSLPYYSLPKFSDNTYRLFEVNENALEPKFSYGDKVLASWVSNVEDINDGNVYVLVTKNNGILLRRVVNKINEREVLQLISDSLRFKNQYSLMELKPTEIYEVWSVECIISSHLDQPIENLYGKIADLEMRLQELYRTIQTKNND